MIKSVFMAFVFAVVAFGQNVSNNIEYARAISNFTGTQLRKTDKFNVGDNEGVRAVIRVPVRDSAKFIVKYQRGYVLDGGESNSGGWTHWDVPACFIDSFNTFVAGNFYDTTSTAYNNGNDTNVVQALDSIQIPGWTTMTVEFETWKTPYGRFWVQGLTGNRVAPYTMYFSVEMLKFSRVETKSQY